MARQKIMHLLLDTALAGSVFKQVPKTVKDLRMIRFPQRDDPAQLPIPSLTKRTGIPTVLIAFELGKQPLVSRLAPSLDKVQEPAKYELPMNGYVTSGGGCL
jgi:hypothetical protein